MSAETKSKIDLIETVTKILQAVAIIAGIWATYFAYQKFNVEKQIQVEMQNQQLAKEFRKSFYEKQLQFYIEAVEATATISTEEKGSNEYNKAKKEFYKLYWGKLSIVENITVETKMAEFETLLKDYENNINGVDRNKLELASLGLAHAASQYTINVWLDTTERKNYNRYDIQ